jgi:hypothetical protein
LAAGNRWFGALSSVGKRATGIGRQIIHALAQDKSEPSSEGEPNPDNE